jgi:hypothetical protein
MKHSYILSPFNIVRCLNTKCGTGNSFFLFFLFSLLCLITKLVMQILLYNLHDARATAEG